ncbi:hypothetical protein [Nocardia sp. NPDC050710]|uniref:hypothetical protein n=1 Tax=Nocardia sp. NPDC050710 TaxID=3157220 RepID=UPI0033FAE7C8
MDVLIIGRSKGAVDTAATRLHALGFTARGVTTDHEALAALDTERFGTLLIGGGVERNSRIPLKASAARHGVTVLEARRNGRDIDTYLREVVLPVLRERA